MWSALSYFSQFRSKRSNVSFRSLAVLFCHVLPLQSLNPGRKSRAVSLDHLFGCYLILFGCYLLFFKLLVGQRVLVCSPVLLRVRQIPVRTWRRDGYHLLWKMNQAVFLDWDSSLIDRKMNKTKVRKKT